jgi:hypothetical protein
MMRRTTKKINRNASPYRNADTILIYVKFFICVKQNKSFFSSKQIKNLIAKIDMDDKENLFNLIQSSTIASTKTFRPLIINLFDTINIKNTNNQAAFKLLIMYLNIR